MSELETALCMKELEVKEKELAMQVRLKELKASAVPVPSGSGNSKPVGFDISKHVCFIPLFQEQEIGKFFFFTFEESKWLQV